MAGVTGRTLLLSKSPKCSSESHLTRGGFLMRARHPPRPNENPHMKLIDIVQSAGVAATATLLILAAGALATHEARGAELPAPDVTLRNVQILDTAYDSWAVATAVNASGETLVAPVIILELPDGTELRHVGPSRVDPGETWRIVEPIPGSTGLKLGGRR